MSSLGGIVPLNVHTEFSFCVGMPGWNFSGRGADGLMPEFRLGATPGLYDMLGPLFPICDTSTATCGGTLSQPWCAHIGPGGRPSIGPLPPPRIGSTACSVWFDSRVGAQ